MTEIDALKYWESKIAGKSANTKKSYHLILKCFFEAVKLTPNQLIEMKKHAAENKTDQREQTEVEDMVLNYIRTNLATKSPATRKTHLSAICVFFKANRYPLSIDKYDFERADSIGSRIPTKEEIAKIADSAKGWKTRAAVMTLKDSGLRCSDLGLLTWEKKVDYGEGFWGWTIITEKRSVKASVFVGPETTRLLSNFKTQTGRLFRSSAANINDNLNRAIKKALGKSNSESGLSAHGLRKFYFSALQHGRVPESYILAMQGKRTSVYAETRPDVLFETYKAAYKELSLITGNGSAQAITELSEQMKHKDSELDALKAQVDSMQNLLMQLFTEKNKINPETLEPQPGSPFYKQHQEYLKSKKAE